MGFDWGNVDVLRAILTVSSTIPFLLFGSAGIWHFGGGHKSGTGLVTITSVLGFIGLIYSIWTQKGHDLWPVLGLALQAMSLFLFGWSVGTSGRKNLGLALNDNSSKKLITDGPYAMVRHPFYTSYILYWAGGAAVAPSIVTALFAVTLIAIYFFTARREDKFLAGLFGDEFPEWHKNTGAFFPKWR
jgi:protein-S-isoprenylcysteine O-methyltransferase Ste14